MTEVDSERDPRSSSNETRRTDRLAKDLRHHLTAESRARKPSPLKSLIKHYSIPDVITLAGGLPHPMYFPFQSISLRVPDVLKAPEKNQRRGLGTGQGVAAHEIMQDLSSFSTMKMQTGGGTEELDSAVDLAKLLQGFPDVLPIIRKVNDLLHPSAYSDRDTVLTCGNTDALSKVARMILERGQVCLMEEFTYPACRETLDPMGVISVGLHIDEQGIVPSHLHHTMAHWEDHYWAKEGAGRPRVLYMVSCGQNPTGVTYGIERRREIYALAQKWDLIIIEDDPYVALQMEPYVPNRTKTPLDSSDLGLKSSTAKAPRLAELKTLEAPTEQLWPLMYDAHAHPTDDSERNNWSDMDKVKLCKSCVMSSCVDNQDFVKSMAHKYPDKVIPCFGYHPWFNHSICFDYEVLGSDKYAHYSNVFGEDPDDDLVDLIDLLPEPVDSRTVLQDMRQNLVDHPSALVGEIGIDRSYRVPNNRQRRLTKLQMTMEAQMRLVESQIALAVELNRPISFHAVQAQGPLLELLGHLQRKYGLAKWNTIRICLHSFSGSVQTLQEIAKKHKNAYFSFSTTINARYKRLPDLIRAAPADRLLIESDWNSTHGMAEKVWQIAKLVAQARDWTIEETLQKTGDTWQKFVHGRSDVYQNGSTHSEEQSKIEESAAVNIVDRYLQSLVPSMCSLDVDGRVIRLDTVSKILAPGMRFGWITANALFIERLTRHSEVSTQTPSGVSGAIMLQLLGKAESLPSKKGSPDHHWGIDGYIRWLMAIRLEYTMRRDIFLDALTRSAPDGLLSWVVPSAGMFVWVKIHFERHPSYRGPSDISSLMAQLFNMCLEKKVIVCPSNMFLAEDDTQRTGLHANFVRLTFARAEWKQLEIGPARFADAVAAFFRAED